MYRYRFFIVFLLLYNIPGWVYAQSIDLSVDYRLASPFYEPDGRNDVVELPNGDLVMLAKTKGSTTGKAEFVIERIASNNLSIVWQSILSIESSEDFKDLYFDGTTLQILSVVHDENQKKTSLQVYSFDPISGSQKEKRVLESYPVSDWVEGEHRGKVKESFIDVICEHTEPGFVTPFEYKHHIQFSKDKDFFVSTVFTYGSKTLVANVSIYTKEAKKVASGQVTIDNDYTNYGIYVNNRQQLFIVNANNGGKLNVIRYQLSDKTFDILELPPSSYKKDDVQLKWISEDVFSIASVAVYNEKLMGFSYGLFDFKEMTVKDVLYDALDEEGRQKIEQIRATDKQLKGTENWMDYELTDVIVQEPGTITYVLEKRTLFVEGYPHISRNTFDKKHQVQLNGHVHTEGILLIHWNAGKRAWIQYIPKHQVYPGSDGLNTISFVLSETATHIQILYASSGAVEGTYTTLSYLTVEKKSGNKSSIIELDNPDKLTLVRDYTVWLPDNKLLLVGRKGLLGKASKIVRYRIPNT